MVATERDPKKIAVRVEDEAARGIRPTSATSEPFAYLVQTIKEDGMAVPVFVHRTQGYVVSGHYRLWAAMEANPKKKVPVVLVESEDEIARWFQ